MYYTKERHVVSIEVSVDEQNIAVYTDVDKSVFSNEVTADGDTVLGYTEQKEKRIY